MTSATTTNTFPTIPITTPSFRTQHILGSLTTTFTPHSDCYLVAFHPDHYSDAPRLITGEIFPGFWCIPSTFWSNSPTTPWYSQCYPSAAKPTDRTYKPFVGPYSPGLYCPEGFTTGMSFKPLSPTGHACMVSDRTLTPNDFFLEYYPTTTLLADETGAICCPSGYEFNTRPARGDVIACTSRLTSGLLTGFECWGNAYTASGLTTMEIGPSETHELEFWEFVHETTTTWSYTGAIVKVTAQPVQLLWRASDEPETTGGTSSPTDGTSTGDGGGFPKAAIIGISVVAGLALLLGVVGAALFVRHQRQKRRRGDPGSTGGTRETAELPVAISADTAHAPAKILAGGTDPRHASGTPVGFELGSGTGPRGSPTELYDHSGWRPQNPAVELDDGYPRVEIYGNPRAEMPST